ncbi:MAG: F0F1 ATP synthase subunit epsilon [Thermomicrobiales bacterium]|nr:F0F1 ATP synthase subunit epsilon [Thermomicrobiales bacterium]
MSALANRYEEETSSSATDVIANQESTNVATLTVEVITGERSLFSESGVEMVSAPGADGTLGILPNHAALISLLDAGELIIKKGGHEDRMVVFGGFIEVLNNKVIVLADSAERLDEIDVERAERARERAADTLKNRSAITNVAAEEAALKRAAVRVRVGKRRSSHRATPAG